MQYDFTVDHIYNVVERQPNRSWNMRLSGSSEQHILVMALEGQADYTVNGRHFSVNAGDLCYFPPGSKREGLSNPEHPWKFLYVSFTLKTFSDSEDELFSVLRGLYSPAPAGANFSLEKMQEMWIGKSAGYRVQCRSILLNLLFMLVQSREAGRFNPAMYKRVETVRRYLQEHMTENPTISELAARVGCSGSHFRMMFRQVTGMSVKQYIHLIRVSRARDLIQAGEANITEAAERTGFRDIYYFSRVFRQTMGCPPSAFYKK